MAPPGRETISISGEHAGQRLDRVLAAHSALSRTRLKALILDGAVTIGARTIRDPGYRVNVGETVAVEVPEPEAAEPKGEHIPLDIVFEDDEIVVIDKPAGLVVHPAAGHAAGTLVNALIAHCGDSLSGIGGVKRPGIVHRLDRGTSGLMVVAKHDAAHEELSRQFAQREVEKEYFALVWGEVMAGRRIDAPIGRDPSNRKKMSSESARVRRTRAAVTRIVRAEHFGRMLTLAQVAIHTGRTHQIRVHLSAIGHPIVGDALYGGLHRRVPGDLRAVTHLDRPFLHAAHLVFKHPDDDRRMEFMSAMPEDLQKVLDELREKFNPDLHGDP